MKKNFAKLDFNKRMVATILKQSRIKRGMQCNFISARIYEL